LHILNVIKTRRISSSEKEENELMKCVSCLLLSQICSRYEEVFFYINISKNYQYMLIKNTKSCVDHDGD
jgi:hypothetical protein